MRKLKNNVTITLGIIKKYCGFLVKKGEI